MGAGSAGQLDEIGDVQTEGAEKHDSSSTEDEVEEANGASDVLGHDNFMLRSLAAGGLAGMMAKFSIAPLERTKILYQVTNERFRLRNVPGLMSKMVRNEGLASLWKGNTATMLRVFPYAGIQFMVFDSLKKSMLRRREHVQPPHAGVRQQELRGDSLLSHRIQEQRSQQQATGVPKTPILTNTQSMFCGGVASATSLLATYPLDLTRARLAVLPQHIRRQHRSELVSLWTSWLRTGGVGALYRGAMPALLGVAPYGAIAFTINEQGKNRYRTWAKIEQVPTATKLVVGAFSGLVAQTVTYPFDVLRRRMQTSGFIDRAHLESGYLSRYRSTHKLERTSEVPVGTRVSMRETLRIVLREQGVRGLFKGVTMNWVKGPVSISISFTMFDLLKTEFGVR